MSLLDIEYIRPQNHTYIPVDTKFSVTEEPTYHDTLPAGPDRFTGTLFCTLRCLTPTLVGCHQIPTQMLLQPCVNVICSRLESRHDLVTEENITGKKIVQPLMLPGAGDDPGDVLIPGDSLKSALFRSPLQSLLSAPMERVKEEAIAYRVFAPNDDVIRAFQVGGKNEETGGVKLKPLETNSVLWPRPEMSQQLTEKLGHDKSESNYFSVGLSNNERQLSATARMTTATGYTTNILISSEGSETVESGYHVFRYGGGLDGNYILARAFDNVEARHNDYQCILAKYQTGEYEVCPKVLQRFARTIDHIYNEKNGHLANHPNKETVLEKMRAVRPNRTLEEGEVVWAEVHGEDIRSIGRLRAYLWIYRDTVLRRFDENKDNDASGSRYRKEVVALNSEKGDDEPLELTAARLLNGFVVTKGQPKLSDPMTMSICTVDETNALAGRLHLNYAREFDAVNREHRFEGSAADEYLLLGRPVGAPRVSSPEICLQQRKISQEQAKISQDNRLLKTWGEHESDQSGGLAGRKNYPHGSPNFQYNPMTDSEIGENEDPGEKRARTACSDQVPLLRYISSTGTEFRFAARVENLRPWELGAILFCVSLDRKDVRDLLAELGYSSKNDLEEFSKHNFQERIQPNLGWIYDNETGEVPDFAQKIGYQRQRGMGSVNVSVDHVSEILFDNGKTAESVFSKEKIAQAKAAFYEKLKTSLGSKSKDYIKTVLCPWLDNYQFIFKHSVERSYRQHEGSTLKYHSKIKEQHRKNRLKNMANANSNQK